MKEFSHYNRITEYEEGRMSSEQRSQFEQDMVSNAELKKEYELYQEAKSIQDVLAYQQLKKTIGGFQNQEAKVVPMAKRVPIWRKPLAIAASLLVLVTASFLLYANVNYSNQNLTNRFYASPNFSDLRSSSNTETTLAKAEKAFNSNKFEDCIAFAKSIDANANNYVTAQNLLAHAYLKNQNFAAAISTFEKLIQSKDPRFVSSAEWYMALAYLKNEITDNAKQLLEKIAQQEGHGYKEDAVKLIAQLDSGWRKIVF